MGSYVNQSLAPGEQVLYEAKYHWIIFLKILPLTIISAGVLPLLLLMSQELALTNRRLIGKGGIIGRHTVEINLNKVESVQVQQGPLGLILNYGTVVVTGTGGTKEEMHNVSNPVAFRKKFQEVQQVA